MVLFIEFDTGFFFVVWQPNRFFITYFVVKEYYIIYVHIDMYIFPKTPSLIIYTSLSNTSMLSM